MSGTDARAARDARGAREARNEEFRRARREVACELREMRRIRRALRVSGEREGAKAAEVRLRKTETRYRAIVKGLPESEREIFHRHVFKGESFKKISEDLFYMEGSAKKIYTRAIDRIAEKEIAK